MIIVLLLEIVKHLSISPISKVNILLYILQKKKVISEFRMNKQLESHTYTHTQNHNEYMLRPT